MDMSTLTMIRKSVRNFTDKPIENIAEVEQIFKYCESLDSKIKTEINIVDKRDLPNKIKNISGYNGYLIDAPNYILIYSEMKPHFIENVGFIGENIIIKLTDMGIDTCWLTIKEEEVVKEPETKLRLTGLIAAGYGGKRKNRKVINKMLWGKGYDNLEVKYTDTDNALKNALVDIVYMGDYGEKATPDDIINSGLYEALCSACHAPSALNRQPWRFIIDGGVVSLIIKKDAYTNIYEAKINAGAVMFNFLAVVKERLFNAEWKMGAKNKYNIPDDCVAVAYCEI